MSSVMAGPLPYPLAIGEAPAKVILAGEHAVVYGHPAVAIPVPCLTARASIAVAAPGYGTVITALDLARATRLGTGDSSLPALAHAVRTTLAQTGAYTEPDWIVQVRSRIPMGRGMGSSAAVTCALVRAVAKARQWHPDATRISAIVFGCEEYCHGTPSGIDNAVVAYAQPLLFRQGEAPRFFEPNVNASLLIADTGLASSTAAVIKAVSSQHQTDPSGMAKRMAEIGAISLDVFTALCAGDVTQLASCMNHNQDLLRELGVSTPDIERLIQVALAEGALSAKLTGAGMGGQVLVLTGDTATEGLQQALRTAGAVAVYRVSLTADTVRR